MLKKAFDNDEIEKWKVKVVLALQWLTSPYIYQQILDLHSKNLAQQYLSQRHCRYCHLQRAPQVVLHQPYLLGRSFFHESTWLNSLVEVSYTEPLLLATIASFCQRNAQVYKKEPSSDFWSHISWSLPKSGSESRTPSHNLDNSEGTSSWELTATSWTRGLSRGRRGRTRYSAKSIQADHLQDIN